MGWREQLARTDNYEAQGAGAALIGHQREQCPYDRDVAPEAWNFWVYGNENMQGKMLREFMAAEGTAPLYMGTGELTEETRAMLEDWSGKCQDAMKRMRIANGWDKFPPAVHRSSP